MKKIIILFICLSSLPLFADTKSEDGDQVKREKVQIPSKADTLVLASNKSAKDFFIELKRRAVIHDYAFESTDADAMVFVTKYKDVSKRAAVQFKVYVKDVDGGSNAIYSGMYQDLKKLKRKPWYRDQKIYKGKSGKAAKHAWKAFMSFGVGSEKWKYAFIKR